MDALIGKKVGMTRVFNEDGTQVPVTVIEVGPCTIVQRKTAETDGYEALQLGFGEQKEHRLSKPMLGHFGKAEVGGSRVLREVAVAEGDGALKAGDSVDSSCFDGVGYVDVTAMSKGRGFQGVVKRWNMAGGRKSHGGGNLRGGGSIGMCETPSRVFKNMKMPGHMGHRQVTVQNLRLVQVRQDDHAILVQGAVPGPNGGYVMVRKALKKAATS